MKTPKPYLLALLLLAGTIGPARAQSGESPLELTLQLGHAGEVYSVAFSPDGRYALSGSNDETLKLMGRGQRPTDPYL